MKKSKISDQLENAEPMDHRLVEKAVKVYNRKTKIARIKIQKKNRASELSATQSRITT